MLNIENAFIHAGGIPPMSFPSDDGVLSDRMKFQQLELYYLKFDNEIIIDLAGKAERRLAEEYRREPV